MSDSPAYPLSTPNDEFDIGPLAWVKREIQFALVHADENIGEFAANLEDLNLARAAQSHLHQVTGALKMVGLEPVTLVSSAAEKLVNAFLNTEINPTREHIVVIRNSIKALSQFLDDLMRGARNQPLTLYPVYKTLLTAVGTTASSPVDLFFPTLLLKPLVHKHDNPSLNNDTNTWLSLKRSEYQKGLLQLLRGVNYQPSLQSMEKVVAAIDVAQTREKTMLWWIAAAFLEGLAITEIPPSPFHKQLCGRLDIEIKHQLDGLIQPAERLIRELLFAIAYMQPTTPRVREVHEAYQLAKLLPPDARDDPQNTRVKIVIGDLKRRLEAVKEAWTAYTSGNLESLSQFTLEAAQLNNFAQSFDNHSVKTLLAKLVDVGNDLTINPREADDALALEIAALLLTAREALDQYNHLGKDFRTLTQTAVVRVSAALNNRPLPPGGISIEYVNLHRAPDDQKLFLQLGQESLKNLNQIEEILESFFRDKSKIGDLNQLNAHIKQLEGVLSMLESPKALTLLRACQKVVEKFIKEGTAEKRFMELIAEGFSNLGLFIVGVQQGYQNPEELLNSALKLFGIPPVNSK